MKDRPLSRSRAWALIRASVSCVAGAIVLSACSTSEPQRTSAAKPASKEYFAESEYGVKASPRVSTMRTRLPRGGGRDQIGKPYKIKGTWYHPREEPDYRKSGMASWYGDAFHGRLTANGEIYDMTHLTAAHPTMPLPSYARVTNKKNGASVVVRVNDRGPYAHGRIVDLSRRAAELLDYTHSGIAQVEVEYMGRAPLHGEDDAFLMASYRPGNAMPDPSDGLPGGIMIAMNGPTPTTRVGSSIFDIGRPSPAVPAGNAGDLLLPAIGPIAPERPGRDLAARTDRLPAMAYAAADVNAAAQALDRLATSAPGNAAAPAQAPYVAIGTFSSGGTARRLARALDDAGRTVVAADGDAFVVTLHGDGRVDTDAMLRAAWAAGAADALIVRE